MTKRANTETPKEFIQCIYLVDGYDDIFLGCYYEIGYFVGRNSFINETDTHLKNVIWWGYSEEII